MAAVLTFFIVGLIAVHFLPLFSSVCLRQRKSSPSSADSSSAVREMVWSYGFPLARYVFISLHFYRSTQPRNNAFCTRTFATFSNGRLIPVEVVEVGVGEQRCRFRPSCVATHSKQPVATYSNLHLSLAIVRYNAKRNNVPAYADYPSEIHRSV